MQSELDPEIKTRADGSIDTAYYMAKGRVARANQAKYLTKKAMGRSKHERKPPVFERFWQMLAPRATARF